MKISDTKFYRHIEYTTIEDVCFRVCRPGPPEQAFLVPILSPEHELERDRAYLRQRPLMMAFPSVNDSTEDPNELRDYYIDPPFDYTHIAVSSE